MRKREILFVVALAVTTLTQAATISWTASELLNVNQFSTSGTLVEAVNFGSANAATINGVTFEAFPDTGNDLASDNFSTLIDQTIGNEKLFVGADAGFDATSRTAIEATDLLDVGFQENNPGGGEDVVALTGLIIGQEYEVQLFFSDDGRSINNGDYIVLDSTSSDTAGLNLGSDHDDVIIFTGTFTADATTQTFTMQRIDISAGNFDIFVNAGQLRVLPSKKGLWLYSIRNAGS